MSVIGDTIDAAKLANWYTVGLTGRGSPLLDGAQARALADYAFERSSIVGVVDAYELRGELEIPTIEMCLYGDAPSLGLRPWREALRARRIEVIALLAENLTSPKELRFQLFIWQETD